VPLPTRGTVVVPDGIVEVDAPSTCGKGGVCGGAYEPPPPPPPFDTPNVPTIGPFPLVVVSDVDVAVVVVASFAVGLVIV
jgi:hypothetical protein